MSKAKSYFLWTVLAGLILASAFWLSQLNRNLPSTYVAYLDFIPVSVNPRTVNVNTDFFIASQLYYPLLQIADKGQLYSHYLDMAQTKALDRDFKKFQLCLIDGVRFSDGTLVKLTHIQSVIEFVSSLDIEIPKVVKSNAEGRCLRIRLAKSDTFFFRHLTALISAPIGDAAADWPVGLGPYVVEHSSPGEIRLRARDEDSVAQFEEIIFKRHSPHAPVKNVVEDFNQLPRPAFPEYEAKDVQVLKRPSFKSYAVVLNFRDQALRQLFARCFPRDEFIKIQNMQLAEIPGFFPAGLVGAQIRWENEMEPVEAERCQPRDGKTLTFYVSEEAMFEKTKDFFARHQSRLPLKVIVQRADVNELTHAMYTRPNNASVVGFEPVRRFQSTKSEGLEYLENFTNPDRSMRLVENIDASLNAKYEKAKVGSEEEQASIMLEAHRALLRSGNVIPLGELTRPHVYPKNLTSIYWMGFGKLNGYPDISRMEWK